MSELAQGESEQLRAALLLSEAWGARIALAHYVNVEGRCSCGSECGSPAKHPLGKGWHESATSNADELRALCASYPHANIGVATGRASGIVVLDVDGELGEQTLAGWIATHGPLPAAPEVKTPRGRHIYFRAPLDVVLRNRAGERGRGLGPGLDLRAEGGFVICPPSVSANGVAYRWAHERSPSDCSPPEVPAWIVERARDAEPAPRESSVQIALPDVGAVRAQRWAAGALARELEAVRAAPEGQRNAQLNTSSFNLGQLAAGGALDAATTKRELVAAAIAIGLSELEAQKTVRSGFAAGFKKDARSAPTRDLPGHSNGASSSERSSEPEFADDSVTQSPSPFTPRYSTTQIFAQLPEQRWAVEGLQIGPGRPTLFVGYGGSAKTLAAQSLALSSAAGHAVWGHFECERQSILHLDYEQGFYASAKRYQRLAAGHGIDWRQLEERIVYIELPRVYLDQQRAVEQYLRACEGFDIIIVDSLRGAAPFTDENDSSFRGALDVLTYVSQRTGCTFIVLHHAGKPRAEKGQGASDARTLARGTGAIFDAAGAVYNFTSSDGARLVRQVKTPAESTGRDLELFELLIEDINADGVRVSWARPKPVDDTARDAAKFERDAARVLELVRRMGSAGASTNTLVARCGLGRGRAIDMLRALADLGQLELVAGPRRSKVYRIGQVQS